MLNLGLTADLHVHLRDGAMMELVTPTVRSGGVGVVYVMPNLVPPITTLEQVVSYKQQLQALAPKTTFLMSFYLLRELTPELIHAAAKADAIQGVKCYPAGVTTNLAAGVDPNDFSAFYPVFQAMQEEGLVLNLHGERPSSGDDDTEDIHVLNAEEKFLPALRKLHHDFPRLRIVLEHCTTQAAIETVDDINKGVTKAEDVVVAATITAHHLYLTVDLWAGHPINFCKPVAKLPHDKRALVAAATSGKPWFFFGSDSAPHPLHTKARHTGVCAGVYTQNHAIAYVAEVFGVSKALPKLKGFVGDFGREFYGLDTGRNAHLVVCRDECVLVEQESVIEEVISQGELVVAPFNQGQTLKYGVEWREV